MKAVYAHDEKNEILYQCYFVLKHVRSYVNVICDENHLRTTRISNNNACLVFVDSGVVTANCNIIEPDADRSEDAPLIQGNKYSNKNHCCLHLAKRGMN